MPARRWIERQGRKLNQWPPVGKVDFGDFRRLSPISEKFGLDRGLCIDRYYIEEFLARFSTDIRGHVLEVGDDRYTKKFGVNRVTRSDVVHVEEGQPNATLVADLSDDRALAPDRFDCIICTQTLQFIYDVPAALRCLYRNLKPGGILLATFAGISQVSRFDMDRWGDYWRFTTLSTRRVFDGVFPPENLQINAYGNVLASVAFLHGMAAEDLTKEELDYHDPDYQLLITVRAVKPVTTP
ncbi:MAG TPA: methyltransferase domain-containing protein [Candidatus Binatia bacterium]|nr:methyltransferase domain-containing protein [Candidatus Binatia bacterium]